MPSTMKTVLVAVEMPWMASMAEKYRLDSCRCRRGVSVFLLTLGSVHPFLDCERITCGHKMPAWSGSFRMST